MRTRRNAGERESTQLFIDPSWLLLNIDVLVNQESIEAVRTFKNVKVYLSYDGHIIGYLLADFLKKHQICSQEASVSVWDSNRNIYVFGFKMTKDLKDIKRNIPEGFIVNGKMTIKVRGKKKHIIQSLIEEQIPSVKKEEVKSQRKEKSIGEVLSKVAVWRKLQNGFYDQHGNYIKENSFDSAAVKVDIAKKTLDDYLLQIRSAKKYGFNFNDQVCERIGKMREFVREEKEKQLNDQQL